MATRIETLKKRKEEIDKKLKEMVQNETRRSSKTQERQKIILGGWLMKHRPELVNKVVQNGLEREQDKNAFAGWEPLSALESAEPQENLSA